ncbi:MAG: DUF2118 domain-containing protein [Sulfolobales archaeon]
MSSEYPYILLEESCNTVSSDRCHCLDLENNILRKSCVGCGRCFIEYPYEEAFKHIYDFSKSSCSKTFIVVLPRSSEGILVPVNTSLRVIEIQGVYIRTLVSEGEEISAGSKIAQILTGKGEFRTFRSSGEGVVVYISDLLEEDFNKIVILVADKLSLQRVEIRDE